MKLPKSLLLLFLTFSMISCFSQTPQGVTNALSDELLAAQNENVAADMVEGAKKIVASSEGGNGAEEEENKEQNGTKNGEKEAVAKNGANADPKNNGKKEDKKDDKKDDPNPKKGFLSCTPGDSEFKFGFKLRLPEFFYGKNLRLINDDNPSDQLLYFRHTLDLNLEYKYGRPKTEADLIYIKMTIRNKGVWGDPESIAATTIAPIKELDAVFGEHRHGIPRHILWIRELWMELSLNDIACLPFCNRHTLTFGAFPFELGRGIALGSAYAVDASDLGYYNEVAIDQYAFGGKLSGDIIKDKVTYDIYGAILDTKCSTFDYTNHNIRGQQYGHRLDQARGFGVMNYVAAGRLRWTPSYGPDIAVRLEPYALFNHTPEQRIELPADARSNLITVGMAGEFEQGNLEWGFDTAFNFGRQLVYGFDRNIIRLENRAGTAVVVNSRVKQAPPGEVPSQSSPLALRVGENQTIINQSAETSQENGQIIGTNSLGTLINDGFRFSDPYENRFRGAMFVWDMGYFICKPDLKICAGFGYASGDANPNKDEQYPGDSDVDGEYEGFIGLQEVYSGTRVKSALYLAGAGKIPRPLAFPSELTLDPVATTISRFSNLIYVGASTYWRPTWSVKKWSVNPNVLAYWSDYTSPFFDATIQRNSRTRFARNYLGLEVNVFVEAELLTDLRYFLVAAIFFPGSHYKDIKGRPLTRAQAAFLNNIDRTGIVNPRVPLLGADACYFLNTGLEYRF